MKVYYYTYNVKTKQITEEEFEAIQIIEKRIVIKEKRNGAKTTKVLERLNNVDSKYTYWTLKKIGKTIFKKNVEEYLYNKRLQLEATLKKIPYVKYKEVK